MTSIIQQAREAGYPVDAEAISAPFNLAVVPVSSAEIDDTVLVEFSKIVRKLARDYRFECELAGIVIFLMILNLEVPSAGDKMTWSKRDRYYKIRHKIDSVKWQEGTDEDKKRILLDSILGLINAIPEKRLKKDSKEGLFRIIREAIDF